MSDDIIRVVRLLEYTGPREKVEEQLARSLGDGLKICGKGDVQIRVATLATDQIRTRPEVRDYWQSEEYTKHEQQNIALQRSVDALLKDNDTLRELLLQEQKGANAR